MVVISIIALLASMAFPAMQSAIVKANMIKVVSNSKQCYLAATTAALDASSTGDASVGWPADMRSAGGTNSFSSPIEYFLKLVDAGYLKPADLKILSAPGYPIPQGGVTNASSYTAANNCFNIGNVADNDDGTAIFLYTKNWSWGAALDPKGKPFGDNGFVVLHRGGDAVQFRKNQATDTSGGIGTQPGDSTPWITEEAAGSSSPTTSPLPPAQ